MNENTCLDFTKLSGAHIRKHCLDDFLFVHSVNKTEFFWFWVTNFGNTGSLFSSYGFINSVIFCNFPFQMGTTAVCSYITADPLTHRSSQQIFWLNFSSFPTTQAHHFFIALSVFLLPNPLQSWIREISSIMLTSEINYCLNLIIKRIIIKNGYHRLKLS